MKGGYQSYEGVYLKSVTECTRTAFSDALKTGNVADIAELHQPVLKQYFTKMYSYVFSDEVLLQNSAENAFDNIARKTAKEIAKQCAFIGLLSANIVRDYAAKNPNKLLTNLVAPAPAV